MKKTRKAAPYLFIAPAIFVLVFCSIIPILLTFGISFSNLSMSQLGHWDQLKFVGFDNYGAIFQDKVFIKSISNTFYYVLIGVPCVILVAFVLAVLLHAGGEKKIYSFFRAVFYSPSVTNMVAIAIVWLYLYNPSIGLLNRILSVFGANPILWLQDPHVAKNALLILSVWKNMGINMLIFLAALQSVPKELYEASALDGAGKLRQLFSITIPNIRFSVFFVMVTTLIGWFAEKLMIREDGSIPQAELTSCGLNPGPLSAKGTYESRIACNLGYKEPAFAYLKVREKDKKHPFFRRILPF